MLLHWNCNPVKHRDEGDAFTMSSDGTGLSIVNLLSSQNRQSVNSCSVIDDFLVSGADSRSISIFNLL
jgi:hypothetical protein